MALTKHLQDMIKHLPIGEWFTEDDLPTAKVPRKSWVLKRLTEECIITHRTEWVNQKEIPLHERTDFEIKSFYKVKL